MRTRVVIHAVDSHTEGMPTRVVTGGVGILPGATMAQRRTYFQEHRDQLRTLLLHEPRGHSAMCGAILQPPTRPDADYGVLLIDSAGCPPMCAHAVIGVATVLVETGMVEVITPVTSLRLDTPAGMVRAEVAVRDDGVATTVTVRNVASFPVALDAQVSVAAVGTVTFDLVFGGTFCAVVAAPPPKAAHAAAGWLATPHDRSAAAHLLDASDAIMAAVTEQLEPVHPIDPTIRDCTNLYLVVDGAPQRAGQAIGVHRGWLDRSPCGTGTSARMTALWARGGLGLGEEFGTESVVGRHFVGRLVEETDVAGVAAVVPKVAGRAWIMSAAHHLLDPDDPFPAGLAPYHLDPGAL